MNTNFYVLRYQKPCKVRSWLGQFPLVNTSCAIGTSKQRTQQSTLVISTLKKAKKKITSALSKSPFHSKVYLNEFVI